MPMLTPFAAARNESFCASSLPPTVDRSIATIFPGYGAAPLRRRAVREHGHEERLADQHALARADQRAEQPSARLRRAVAEDRLHLDPVVHVHHAAGFGDRRFVGIEIDLDVLHVVAEN